VTTRSCVDSRWNNPSSRSHPDRPAAGKQGIEGEDRRTFNPRDAGRPRSIEGRPPSAWGHSRRASGTSLPRGRSAAGRSRPRVRAQALSAAVVDRSGQLAAGPAGARVPRGRVRNRLVFRGAIQGSRTENREAERAGRRRPDVPARFTICARQGGWAKGGQPGTGTTASLLHDPRWGDSAKGTSCGVARWVERWRGAAAPSLTERAARRPRAAREQRGARRDCASLHHGLITAGGRSPSGRVKLTGHGTATSCGEGRGEGTCSGTTRLRSRPRAVWAARHRCAGPRPPVYGGVHRLVALAERTRCSAVATDGWCRAGGPGVARRGTGKREQHRLPVRRVLAQGRSDIPSAPRIQRRRPGKTAGSRSYRQTGKDGGAVWLVPAISVSVCQVIKRKRQRRSGASLIRRLLGQLGRWPWKSPSAADHFRAGAASR